MPSVPTSSAWLSEPDLSQTVSHLELFKTQANQALARSGRIGEECESLFRNLLHSDFLLTFLNQELRKIAKDTRYFSSHIDQERVILAQSPRYNLYLKKIERSHTVPPYLYGVVADLMIGVVSLLKGGAVHFECFEQQDQLQTPILDRTKKLIRHPDKVAAGRDIISFRAGRDIYRIAPGDTPVLLLVFASDPLVNTAWQFDRSTLLPVRAMSTSQEASRLESTARMLAELGDPSSITALKGLIQHPEHFVRWGAIRAVARIDAAEGLAMLQEARNDPHPHVRSAVLRELEQAAASGFNIDRSLSAS